MTTRTEDISRRDEDRGRRPARGRLVEGIRLLCIALLGAGGFLIGGAVATESTFRAVLFVFLGAATGFVVGGVAGRVTARAVRGVEENLRRKPAPQLAGGVVGLLVGLIVSAMIMVPLLLLPPAAGWPAIFFVYLVFGSIGERVGESRYEEIFSLIGMKPRASMSGPGDLHVLDTSALIDGRISDLVATGFISGTLLLHEGVLGELQSIADSSDHRRRSRGRHGLDVLTDLQKAPTVEIQLVEEQGVLDVDAALVRLARERRASLVTVDHNLAKVAEALRVPVAQINALASKFRTPYTAGDPIEVHLVKEGREHGQGVGYLDDGTMVVVEQATEHLGEDVDAQVTNVIQTTTGRMVFAALSAAD